MGYEATKTNGVRSREDREARLNVRLPSEQKALIDRAASYSGLTTTAFTVSTLVDRARKVVEKHELTVLSDSDRDRFLAILDMQAAPNAALRRAAENHRRLIESSED